MSGPRALAWLLLGAALLTGLAWFAVRGRSATTAGEGPAPGTRFLPELRERAESLDRIELRSGESVALLQRRGDGWSAPGKADMPVELVRVQELVRGLAGLEVDRALTADPGRHDELGLSWPDESGRATLVRLFAGGADPFAEVVLGETRFSPPGVYARRLGEAQTWRLEGRVEARADAMRFLAPVALEIPADAISAIEWPGGVVVRDEEVGWTVVGEAPEPRREEAARLLPELFTRLDFDDVRADPAPVPADALRLVARVGDRTVALALVPATAGATADAGADPSPASAEQRWIRVQIGDPEPGLGAAALSEAAIAALEAGRERTAGRAFRLPAWRASRLEALLAPPPPADEPAAPAGE